MSLFNAVPARAIEVLSDAENQPWFKRADLGRFLGITDIKAAYRDIDIIPREQLCRGVSLTHPPNDRGVLKTLLKQSQNVHDAFVNLEAALEIVVRSRKPKAVELTKWLTRKGVEKVIKEHQKAIDAERHKVQEKDTQIQQLEYDNVGLQDEIRAKDEEIHRRQEELHAERHMVQDLIQNRHVPRSGNIDTVLVMIEKNRPDEPGKAGLHPFYMLRCQKMQVNQRLSVLRAKYPDMEVLEPECDDPNAIHAWNRFKRRNLTRVNYYRNHFTLPDDTVELFEDLFDIRV